ncbi:MAG: hypothetical protein R3285_00635 [Kiloniellales bacterium]|nr:hypothetical protein [Kiloniellales bacterium]
MRTIALGPVLALAFAASACNVPPPQNEFPEITYKHRPAIRFDVAELVVERDYAPPLDKPNVDHLMPNPPAALAIRWAQDRLVPQGQADKLVFRIVDASVIETEIESDSGLQEMFTVSQSERYNARVAVEVELVEDDGFTRSIVKAEAERSITLAEDASLREREQVWFKLAEMVMNDLDAELEKSLYRHMAAHIVN